MNTSNPPPEIENNDTTAYPTPYTVDLFELEGDNLGTYMEIIKLLPKPLSRIATDQTTGKILYEEFAPKFQLSREQTDTLTSIVRDVLISAIYVGDLIQEISARLEVPMNTAEQIANALIAKVFTSAMDDIKALQVRRFKDRIGQKPTTPPPAPPVLDDNVINLRNKR